MAFLTNKLALYAALGLLVVAGGYFAFSNGGNGDTTMTAAGGDFMQEVSVSGKVVAAQEVDMGFSQSGRVTRVYAAVGQKVAAGAVLAEVENGDLRAAVQQREAALEREKSKLEALKEGARPEEISVAETSVANTKDALVDAIREAYTDADDAVRNQADKFISNPRSLTPQLIMTVSDSAYASAVQSGRVAMEKLLTDWKIEADALTPSSDLPAAAARAQGNLSKVSLYLSDAAAALSRAITNQSVTQAMIDGYVVDVAGARSGVNTAISALTAAVSSLSSAEKNLTLKRAGASASDIAAQAAQVKAAEADVASARAALLKTLIVAPFTGTVTVVDAKVGKIVSMNTPEISMMSSGIYQIESFVPEVHVALLELGDAARVTLDAYGDGVPFGASVISIDPAETVRDGVSTYRAMLQFKNNDPRIRAGMTANVVIITEEKKGVISVPEGAIVSRGGKKFVRVKEGGETAEREVVTGSRSSLGDVEIVSGLSEGDIVVLKSAE